MHGRFTEGIGRRTLSRVDSRLPKVTEDSALQGSQGLQEPEMPNRRWPAPVRVLRVPLGGTRRSGQAGGYVTMSGEDSHQSGNRRRQPTINDAVVADNL